jgi:hypothetical protein
MLSRCNGARAERAVQAVRTFHYDGIDYRCDQCSGPDHVCEELPYAAAIRALKGDTENGY